MRIVQLTAGTGDFHCGTCIRDNALVVELRRQGHDALLVPLYLPLVLDEESATPRAPLFFGGINVYLQQKSALFRKTPRWLDRLLDSPLLLRAAARLAGMTRARDLGELTLSMLRGEDGRQAKELDHLTAWMDEEARPEVVCLSNALLIGLARRIKEATGAAVLCFMNGEDSFLDGLPEPQRQAAWDAIADRAQDVDAFLPVSRYFSDLMRERGVFDRLPRGRVRLVYPGISLEGYEVGQALRHSHSPPVLGYLARMCPAKGLETLVEAYLLLRRRGRFPDLRLRVAGSCSAADRPFVARLRERLEDPVGRAGGSRYPLAGRGERHPAPVCTGDAVEFLPNISRSEKIAYLQSLSAFSVPATYGEAFGLYLVEAMAAGVPVVQPRHAAFPEVLEKTGGGVLCAPDDPQSLAAAVEGVLADAEAARAMGEQGRRVVREQFTIERMAREVLDAIDQAGGRSRPVAAATG